MAGFVADGGGGEGRVEPGGRGAGGGGEEGLEFGIVETAVVVFVEEEEEVDEEAVAGWGELGGGVRRDVEFGVEEAVAEAETVGVVEGAEDYPEGFVAAFFDEESVEEEETCLVDALFRDSGWRCFPYGLFDVFEVTVAKRFSKAFHLEGKELLVA